MTSHENKEYLRNSKCYEKFDTDQCLPSRFPSTNKALQDVVKNRNEAATKGPKHLGHFHEGKNSKAK